MLTRSPMYSLFLDMCPIIHKTPNLHLIYRQPYKKFPVFVSCIESLIKPKLYSNNLLRDFDIEMETPIHIANLGKKEKILTFNRFSKNLYVLFYYKNGKVDIICPVFANNTRTALKLLMMLNWNFQTTMLRRRFLRRKFLKLRKYSDTIENFKVGLISQNLYLIPICTKSEIQSTS